MDKRFERKRRNEEATPHADFKNFNSFFSRKTKKKSVDSQWYVGITG